MNQKTISIIGFLATALGMGLSLVSNWVAGKKISYEIERQILEHLKK